MRAIALCYHDLLEADGADASGFSGSDCASYKLSPEMFRRHVRAIADGIRRGSDADGAADKVAFTFDDGGKSSLLIADILEENGFRGYFFVPTDYIGAKGFLEARQISELRRRGHQIGSHSCSHRGRMSHKSTEALRQEWDRSVAILSELIQEPVTAASVPSGYYSRRVAEAAATEGVSLLFTLEPTRNRRVIAGCTIAGRYLMRNGTPASRAQAIASGAVWPRLRQQAYWNMKKAAKMLPFYTRVRRAWFDFIRA